MAIHVRGRKISPDWLIREDAPMRLRQWGKLEYFDPRALLIALNDLTAQIPLHKLPYKVASLRTNQLKRYREGRQCALFCFGIGQALGLEVRFAMQEESDIDFVGRFEKNDEVHFVPIQIKELVPEKVRHEADLQTEIDKLNKYADSQDLVVAFHVNRNIQLDPSALDLSKVPFKELWLFGATTESQEEWFLLGNLLSPSAHWHKFRYPNG